jgi:hypothetical protein
MVYTCSTVFHLSPCSWALTTRFAPMAAGEPGPGSSQPRLTAAEISQRSVDLLLREYYKVRPQAIMACSMHTRAFCQQQLQTAVLQDTAAAALYTRAVLIVEHLWCVTADGPSSAAYSSKASRCGCERGSYCSCMNFAGQRVQRVGCTAITQLAVHVLCFATD